MTVSIYTERPSARFFISHLRTDIYILIIIYIHTQHYFKNIGPVVITPPVPFSRSIVKTGLIWCKNNFSLALLINLKGGLIPLKLISWRMPCISSATQYRVPQKSPKLLKTPVVRIWMPYSTKLNLQAHKKIDITSNMTAIINSNTHCELFLCQKKQTRPRVHIAKMQF